MYRHELKYIINEQSANILKSKIKTVCSYDENASAKGGYKVTSLYFDDYCNSALNDNIDGNAVRKKFRIRVYDRSDAMIRLERKSKNNGGCKKDSVVISREQYEDICKGDYSSLDITSNPVLRDFYILATTKKLKPKIIVEYDREAFIYDFGTVRITIDQNVRYGVGKSDMFDQEAEYPLATGQNDMVLEVKYTGFLPNHIRAMIQGNAKNREAFSKYTMSRMGSY